RDHGATAAPLLVDQRVEGAHGFGWPTAGYRADPAGLVLRRRDRAGAGTDHRPGVFPVDRRHRALVVPAGAQAWRAPTPRLALRAATPVPEVRQPGALRGLRPRHPSPGGTSVAPGLPAHGAARCPWHRVSRIPAGAVRRTRVGAQRWITSEQPVRGIVPSGVTPDVPSGAGCSCHQAQASVTHGVALRTSDGPNASNLESLTVVAASRSGGQPSNAARQRQEQGRRPLVLLARCIAAARLLPALPNHCLPEEIPWPPRFG